jgi:xanthine dehydrogenase accessory factor
VTTSITDRITELTHSRVPFVRATVVRAQKPASARAGDRAIILADGSIEGFVGGQCAESSVRSAALDTLGSGESLLLRVLPGEGEPFPDTPGASVVVNPCLSGGALEIYLEPLLPPPLVHLVGSSPIAEAVAELASGLGYVVDRATEGGDPTGATAVVIASHGGDESDEIRAALDAGVGFVGVVCSRTRGQAILDGLGLTDDEARRVHTHVGIAIGARTAPEVALSIMAALVRDIRLHGVGAAPGAESAARPMQAVDPVCGMTITIGPDAIHATVDGVDHWFCGAGCRSRFLAELAS